MSIRALPVCKAWTVQAGGFYKIRGRSGAFNPQGVGMRKLFGTILVMLFLMTGCSAVKPGYEFVGDWSAVRDDNVAHSEQVNDGPTVLIRRQGDDFLVVLKVQVAGAQAGQPFGNEFELVAKYADGKLVCEWSGANGGSQAPAPVLWLEAKTGHLMLEDPDTKGVLELVRID